ncbi:prefoldin subunit alpha [Halovivax gelatinilyticus]|uniref:prefoldin subunit alpha n=1 Tax=Halovivax gelatinilyticus TaxID=2961597 RepID=UPI0020CA5AF5|nr:prefoldin subunit alpha [Halovivax gelatinilyticus]
MSGGQQQLQALSQELQQIQETIASLEETIEGIRTEQSSIDDAITAVEALETDSTVQVPLGGGAYVRATVEDVDEVLVSLGADYAAEFGRERAVETLENKRTRLDERIEEVNDRIADLEAESSQLEQQAQQLQQQALQQQMGAMGGQSEPDE